MCAWLQGDFDGFVVLTTSFHRDIAGVEVVCFNDVVGPHAAVGVARRTHARVGVRARGQLCTRMRGSACVRM